MNGLQTFLGFNLALFDFRLSPKVFVFSVRF